MTLYEKIMKAGIDVDHHCSDLYFPKTEESMQILQDHMDEYGKVFYSFFRNQITGETWVDVAFHYEPYWRTKK